MWGRMKLPFRHGKPRKGRPVDARENAEVVFVSGGLKAAMNTPPSVRQKIIHDVSEALNCSPLELEFLFSGTGTDADEASIYDFPDSERRRRIIRDNRLDAAE